MANIERLDLGSILYNIEPHASTYQTKVNHWLLLLKNIQDKKNETIIKKGLVKFDKDIGCIIFFSKNAVLVSLFHTNEDVTVVLSLWAKTINEGEYHTYKKYNGKNINWTAKHNDFLVIEPSSNLKKITGYKTVYYFTVLSKIDSHITYFNDNIVATLIIKPEEVVNAETIELLLKNLTTVKALIICGTCDCNFTDLSLIESQSVAFVYCTNYTGEKGKNQTDSNFATKTFFFCTDIEASENKIVLKQEKEHSPRIDMNKLNQFLDPNYLNEFEGAEIKDPINLSFRNNENPILSKLSDYSVSDVNQFILDTTKFVNDLSDKDKNEVLDTAIETLKSTSNGGGSSLVKPLANVSEERSIDQSDDNKFSVNGSLSADITIIIDKLNKLKINPPVLDTPTLHKELKQPACKVCGIKLAQ